MTYEEYREAHFADPPPAERFRAALLAAGAAGHDPIDTLMYWPVRYGSAIDPLGTVIAIFARRGPVSDLEK